MRQLPLGIQNSELALSSGLTANNTPQSGISEIILAADSALQPVYLLPILAQMSLDKRWLMWIGDEHSLNRNWVSALGIDTAQVLYIKAEEPCFLQVCCKALSAGTGHIIIEWTGKISDEELTLLDEAAKQGNSHGLLIRRR